MNTMTKDEMSAAVDTMSNTVFDCLEDAEEVIETMVKFHRENELWRGYQRSEADLKRYLKAARLLYIMRCFMFSEDGATHEMTEQLEKALDAIEL